MNATMKREIRWANIQENKLASNDGRVIYQKYARFKELLLIQTGHPTARFVFEVKLACYS
jgi:hypothetical protein